MKRLFTYDHYFRYGEMAEKLQILQQKYPQYLRLYSIGKSQEGRDIWAVEATDFASGSCSEKPALYLDGTHHATEYVSTMQVMYFLDALLTDDRYAPLLANTAFYCIPCVSPDGMEYALTTPEMLISNAAKISPEASGLIPKDLDGDGVLRMMRFPSPYGIWKKDPDDARMMLPRLPYETSGEFYHVCMEGVLQNWDGLDVNPAPGYNDMLLGGDNFNRNYPYQWQAKPSAGDYPLSFPETRCVSDFLLQHRNIGFVVSMHAPCGLYFYPPTSASSYTMADEDRLRYEALAAVSREMVGFRAMCPYDGILPAGSCTAGGSLIDWAQFGLGIPACTIEIWDAEARAGKPHDGSEKPFQEHFDEYRMMLDWNDHAFGGRYYKDWTPCPHPQLGTVEIGGLDAKGLLEAPPPELLEAHLEQVLELITVHAKILPHLSIDRIDAKHLHDSVWEVSAVVGNRGWLPTFLSSEALEKGKDSPVVAVISGVECIDGPVQNLQHLAGFSGTQASVSMYGFGCGTDLNAKTYEPTRKRISRTVIGQPGDVVTLTVSSPAAGVAVAEVTLISQ